MTTATKDKPSALTMNTTNVFEFIMAAWLNGKRRVKLEGGTASSKTFSALQFLYLVALNAKSPLVISVVSESLPHLRKGCIKDFFSIIGESQDNNPRYFKTKFAYKFNSGSVIEFFGVDDEGKVRGPRRDILFINEANNVSWETARGLDFRSPVFTILDWNPVGHFWAHDNWADDETVYNHSTYLDALHVIPEQTVKDIESYRDKDPNWWNIYGLGRLGKITGLVHPFFEQCDKLPDGDFFYGLDFGFSSDPTVLVKNVITGDNLYSQEMIYEPGLTNDQIAQKMRVFGVRTRYDEIIADSAEPKSIEEIYRFGFNIKGCEKGPGSAEYGIQKVNQFKQFWTKDSLNCINEQRNYRYIEDKNKQLTEKTTHKWSHGMDARRYALMSKFALPEPPEQIVIYDSMQLIRGIEL